MPSTTAITVPQLSRLVGLPDAPVLVDVRIDDDYQADPRLLPASYRRDFKAVSSWAAEFSGSKVVVICQRGQKLSQGVAAWLRHEGIAAESLEGGFEAWAEAKAPVVKASAVPPRDERGRTVWVTRSRPKVDRIACPWLIRRFVDPKAVFLFVDPAEVPLVAERFAAVPFDIEGVFWSHRGDRCTFDTMIEEFGLRIEALDRLALIVRGADTARLDLVPQAAGFLAASLGLSRMFRDDLEQLEAGMLLYDAFFRWCRDATDETHNWPVGGKAQ
ncbi:sulfurtransferase/chromate resistance protein [Mesorhizobium dulcispinae]|uniref:sulfurtransferase/chromate resistance protein n=1 Tax=Mesorhizobium dulcispinae TaxID=3072316 RepID=UPI002A24BD15|nr:sulfurtransferase/chromate resistance protein [Mesorhizobium sp. VK23D]MDX8518605.1 sulfurtransferase/chromate resistance protein [Mesorhizobium sp. VK23D]